MNTDSLNMSGPKIIRSLNTFARYCLSFLALLVCALAFFSFFFYFWPIAVFFSSLPSLRLKLYTNGMECQYVWLVIFFYKLIARSSILVWFKTTLLAIASLAALRVLYRRVSWVGSSVWSGKKETSSSTFFTCSVLAGVGDNSVEKNRDCTSVTEQLIGALFRKKVFMLELTDRDFLFTVSF